MYEIYCKLRDEKGYKDADVARITGISKSTFSDWKSGRSAPKVEKLKKIADCLDVPVEYLMGKNSLVRCPICGLTYDASNLEDCKLHEQEHTAFETAVKHFGTIYPGTMYESIKNKYLHQATDDKADMETRINAWIEVFRAYWSRSLRGCSYDLNHPDFDQYASMLLNQPHFKDRINSDFIYGRLVNMYGTSKGLENGRTYYRPKNNSSALTPRDERDIKKDVDAIMAKLESGEAGPAAYDGQPLSPESAELFRDALDVALRQIKILNKEKYNPHKNKK